MEYCGAGSVLDIMKLRGIHFGLPRGEVKPLNEEEIATVLSDTLKGSIFVY
jgi:serine/threonine kinase 3